LDHIAPADVEFTLHFVWIGKRGENGKKMKGMMLFPLFGCQDGKEEGWSWIE
jgi:hypothetical protein